jgi:hypothetical protein
MAKDVDQQADDNYNVDDFLEEWIEKVCILKEIENSSYNNAYND